MDTTDAVVNLKFVSRQLGVTTKIIFDVAHAVKHKQIVDTHPDHLCYLQVQHVPEYVIDFCDHVLGKSDAQADLFEPRTGYRTPWRFP